MKWFFIAWVIFFNTVVTDTGPTTVISEQQPLLIRRCEDFELTGKGDDTAWKKAQWISLKKLDPEGADYQANCKVLYSSKGIYVLFTGQDYKVSTEYNEDFGNLFKGDVFEVFFQPDPKLPVYLEYEINPLGKELVLLIPRLNKGFSGWRPWHYAENRKVRKQVAVEGGRAASNAAISSWSAELFFPYELLQTFSNVPPASGTVWKANFYRLDYDSGSMVKWAWSPVEKNFHEYQNFGTIQFE